MRYKIEVHGQEILEQLQQSGEGVLFLASHPSHMDGSMVSTCLLNNGFKINIWAYDFVFKQPYTGWAGRKDNGLKLIKVPNVPEQRSPKFSSRIHKLINRTVDNLRKGKSYLIFPAGRCKLTPFERINGKSAIHKILQIYPDVKIVLVNIEGMWGSRFSWAAKRYPHWKNENMRWREILKDILKMVFYNFIFFIPKRKVTIVFKLAGPGFPRQGTRLEVNHYLENSFNMAYGPEGELLQRVPDFFWNHTFVPNERIVIHYGYNPKLIPETIRRDIVEMIAKKSNLPAYTIKPNMRPGFDLGLDSLEITDLLSQIELKYQLVKKNVPDDISTVGHLMALAAKIPIDFEDRRIEIEEIQF